MYFELINPGMKSFQKFWFGLDPIVLNWLELDIPLAIINLVLAHNLFFNLVSFSRIRKNVNLHIYASFSMGNFVAEFLQVYWWRFPAEVVWYSSFLIMTCSLRSTEMVLLFLICGFAWTKRGTSELIKDSPWSMLCWDKCAAGRFALNAFPSSKLSFDILAFLSLVHRVRLSKYLAKSDNFAFIPFSIDIDLVLMSVLQNSECFFIKVQGVL